MSLYDFFHKYFGDRNGRYTRPPEADSDENDDLNIPSDFFRDPPDEESDMRDFWQSFINMNKHMGITFQLFNEMTNLMEEFSRTHEFDSFFEPSNLPASEGNQVLRDHYLKSGLRNNPHKEDTRDEDHNERPSISSLLDDFAPATPGLQDGTSLSQPRVFSFMTKITRKSVMLPDGTVKTEETVTSSDGNEQRTEIHTLPDGSIVPNSGFSISDLFKYPTPPEIKKIDLKDYFLKPGYEKFNLNAEKIDKDLDKQILQSGIESLPSLPKQPQIIETPRSNKLSCSESFSYQIITRRTKSNGVVETEKIIRYPDGTEMRTTSQTISDGSPLSRTIATGTSVLQGVKDIIDVLFK